MSNFEYNWLKCDTLSQYLQRFTPQAIKFDDTLISNADPDFEDFIRAFKHLPFTLQNTASSYLTVDLITNPYKRDRNGENIHEYLDIDLDLPGYFDLVYRSARFSEFASLMSRINNFRLALFGILDTDFALDQAENMLKARQAQKKALSNDLRKASITTPKSNEKRSEDDLDKETEKALEDADTDVALAALEKDVASSDSSQAPASESESTENPTPNESEPSETSSTSESESPASSESLDEDIDKAIADAMKDIDADLSDVSNSAKTAPSDSVEDDVEKAIADLESEAPVTPDTSKEQTIAPVSNLSKTEPAKSDDEMVGKLAAALAKVMNQPEVQHESTGKEKLAKFRQDQDELIAEMLKENL